MAQVVEVILPLPVKSNFDYRIPEDLGDKVMVGMRVLVGFGKSKIYTGVIRKLYDTPPASPPLHRIKFIEGLLDEVPSFSSIQLDLFDWIAYYYICTPGEVIKAALPQGLKPESALKVEANPGINWSVLPLDDKEFLLMEALDIQTVLGFKEITEIWGIKHPLPRLKAMAARELIHLSQTVEERYKPRFKSYLKLHPQLEESAALEAALDSLSRAPHQENLLMQVVMGFHQQKLIPKTDIQKQLKIGPGIAKALLKKGFIEEEKVQVDRLALYGYDHKDKEIAFTALQQKALEDINSTLQDSPGKPILLHGVTGSGKTHLYIELIRDALAANKQVLYLLPEITLTKQIIDRIKSVFGAQVGIYHSRFNDHERVEIWEKVRNESYNIVIGVRSAIFLPFRRLGLIVVDEAHDRSFKQTEPSPRYHARDVAVYYGVRHKVPVILGSATPSLESYYNALQDKYRLIELPERATDSKLPEIELVDMRMQRKKRLNQGMFSKPLLAAMQETLERGEQVILFQNRRGYAPYLICETCGHVPECVNCDISLTFHKEKNHLRCHYCGYTQHQVSKCASCGNFTLRRAGIGTEQIAEAVAEHFPDSRIQRMDLDTTRSKLSFQQIIDQFERQEIDILVGTQMVSKGLDFEQVTLVGVIMADHLLNFPDFRAYEYAYQLLTQVSGRAGRASKPGRVLIQTLNPQNPVLQLLQQPFPPFFQREIPTRQEIAYPPFTRLLRIEIKHKDREFIEKESLRLHKFLHPIFGAYLLGPDFALIPRLRNQYRMQYLVKLGKNWEARKIRVLLQDAINDYYEVAPTKSLRIILDIDPV